MKHQDLIRRNNKNLIQVGSFVFVSLCLILSLGCYFINGLSLFHSLAIGSGIALFPSFIPVLLNWNDYHTYS
jgi:hypothetical protein